MMVLETNDEDRSATHRRARRSDESGIALQTIIVMVVLLAIAGAVAAVLLNRAGSETDRLENETVNFPDYKTKFACETVTGAWTAGTDQNSDGDTNDRGEGTCGASGGGTQPVASDFTDYAGCDGAGFTWNDNDTDNDGDPLTGDTDGTCT